MAHKSLQQDVDSFVETTMKGFTNLKDVEVGRMCADWCVGWNWRCACWIDMTYTVINTHTYIFNIYIYRVDP